MVMSFWNSSGSVWHKSLLKMCSLSVLFTPGWKIEPSVPLKTHKIKQSTETVYPKWEYKKKRTSQGFLNLQTKKLCSHPAPNRVTLSPVLPPEVELLLPVVAEKASHQERVCHTSHGPQDPTRCVVFLRKNKYCTVYKVLRSNLIPRWVLLGYL